MTSVPWSRRGRRSLRGAAAVVGLLVLLGCSPPAAPTTTPTPAASITPVPPACTAGEDGEFWVPPGAGGDAGAVYVLGSGDRGVVLAPQSDGDICQWLPQGRRLAGLGYRVAMLNWDVPYETPVVNAVARLREAGVRRLVLVGASQGGAYALGLAAELRPTAVISLSGEVSFGGFDNRQRIRGFRGPLLLVGSEEDGYTPGDATRNLARAHPGPHQVIVLPGSAHGLALLVDPEVGTAFDRFLAEQLAAR